MLHKSAACLANIKWNPTTLVTLLRTYVHFPSMNISVELSVTYSFRVTKARSSHDILAVYIIYTDCHRKSRIYIRSLVYKSRI